MNAQEKAQRSLTNISPSPEGIRSIEHLRYRAKNYMDAIFEDVPDSREKSLAITKLEESVMWGVKGIVLNDPDGTER